MSSVLDILDLRYSYCVLCLLGIEHVASCVKEDNQEEEVEEAKEVNKELGDDDDEVELEVEEFS